MIDYRAKLTTHRAFYPIEDLDASVESDRGRIVSSPAFRRLQKRTQVFPLELNAAVRSRLTHSLEVQQTSRFIAKSVLAQLKASGNLEVLGLAGLENAFVSTAEMASLLHDIGNPPFGHFAETAIGNWMRQNAGAILAKRVPNPSAKGEALKAMLLRDLADFDGNAQAIRVVQKLQRLNLSYTQTAAIIKYSRGAFEPKPDAGEPLAYIRKKPGYYYSEKVFVEAVWQVLGVVPGRRFPITYIMEAADDIAYLTADLEDAVDKKLLGLDDIYRLILEEVERLNAKNRTSETYLADLVEKFYQKVQNDDKPYRFNLFLTLLRARLITDLVGHVSRVYLQNHEAIFEGTFNHSLLEFSCESRYLLAVEALRNLSIRHIYCHRDVETLELKGHAVLTGLLSRYRPVLEISGSDVAKLLDEGRIADVLAQKLFRRLPRKQVLAYAGSVDAIDAVCGEDERMLLEWYYRARLLLDYISGMTDDFALGEYQTLSAII